MPMYNEGKIIENTLNELKQFLDKDKDTWEVLMVNDGSTDNTMKILENFKDKFFKIISYNKNRGKGYAVKKGVEVATGDIICFTDADLAYTFENLKEFIEKLKDSKSFNFSKKDFAQISSENNNDAKSSINMVDRVDGVIGSRDLSTDNHENIGIIRRIMGRGFNALTKIILGYRAKDTQSGLKVFKKDVAKDIFGVQTIFGFSFDVEILYIAKKRNYKIIPGKAIVLQHHISKDSKINLLKDSLFMFGDLIKIRINDLKGNYNG